MKKLILLVSVLVWAEAPAQSSITIEPYPSTAGSLTNLKLNSSGRIVAINDASRSLYYNASNLDFFPNTTLTTRWDAFSRDVLNTRIACFDNTQTESAFMLAPIDLPDGAVLSRMRAHYIDNTSDETLFIELIRREKQTTTISIEDIMASLQSPNTNSTSVRLLTTTTIFNITIDNNTYQYFIKVKIGDYDGIPTQQWRGGSLGIRNVELRYSF